MGRLSLESYINQRVHTAETLQKQGARLWAAAKNNPGEGYKFTYAREKYEKAKTHMKRADEARKRGYW